MVEDNHAPQDNMSGEQWDRAEDLYVKFTDMVEDLTDLTEEPHEEDEDED